MIGCALTLRHHAEPVAPEVPADLRRAAHGHGARSPGARMAICKSGGGLHDREATKANADTNTVIRVGTFREFRKRKVQADGDSTGSHLFSMPVIRLPKVAQNVMSEIGPLK